MEDEQPPYAYEEAAEADEEPDAPLYPEEDLHLLDRTDVVANLDVDEEDEVRGGNNEDDFEIGLSSSSVPTGIQQKLLWAVKNRL